MFQMMQAIAFMHKHGFFHRDIKPENTLIKVRDRAACVFQPVLLSTAVLPSLAVCRIPSTCTTVRSDRGDVFPTCDVFPTYTIYRKDGWRGAEMKWCTSSLPSYVGRLMVVARVTKQRRI